MTLNYSLNEIELLAEKLVKQFESFRIFCFEGALGAGKTTLIEAICRYLGSKDPLSSPTFSIVNEYDSPKGILFHMDWYRLKNEEEAIQIGIEDYLYSGHYCFIEWHKQAETLIPKPFVHITLTSLEASARSIKAELVEE
jgi:tRNA threonylcarbamoyladenosine biosynthesis protein TsaE